MVFCNSLVIFYQFMQVFWQCECVFLRRLITESIIWHDIGPHMSSYTSFVMAAVVSTYHCHRANLSKKTKCFINKGGCDVRVLRHLKEELV